MFLAFFAELRAAKIPVTLREYLTLMEALDQDLAGKRVDDFYYLSRACLVKDERNLDKFDRVFGHVFKGLENLAQALEKAEIPEEWLKKLAEKYLTEEEKRQIEAMGWEKLLETLRERLKEQKGRHQGGSKWIGTAGSSPYGAYGYNPEGVRIGQDKNRNFRAVKVWDKREFKDLDDTVELGVRNMRVALRRLRRFARTGAAEELDLDGTIKETASRGYLDVKLRPYPSDYRAVFVGDASMSPYEIVMPGGSVEHWNEEAGQVWMERLLGHFHKAVWLNPVPQKHWDYTQSIGLLRRLFGGRMFPLTLEGIDQAMRELVR